ncbi:MAG TPA: HEXXH motif domain-containing protein [Pseudonocardiaceae bacterium]|nr:HEXXH motif domain-containing protein [Pseudonocardiaceae bacterium]
MRQFRYAERSRRLLLLRAVLDEATRNPDLTGPLPSPDLAWDLLTHVQEVAPAAVDAVLGHPYTGSWLGHLNRLIQCRTADPAPFWVHLGHLHSLAAAAAIRGNVAFRLVLPVWDGGVVLPTLGVARLGTDAGWATAKVISDGERIELNAAPVRVVLTGTRTVDGPNWWSVPRITVTTDNRELSIRLDSLDPYRGAYEPKAPERPDWTEVKAWQGLLDDAWRLIVRCLPDYADAMQAGLDSLVPRAPMTLRTPSASSGDAFGSVISARPADAESLAAILVHEFQHIRLSGLLRIAQLYENDPRERFYAAWREDPRPIRGVVQGTYAFFGITALWRALAASTSDPVGRRRAQFEFAFARAVTWRAVGTLGRDESLTDEGRRFVAGIADVLGRWQTEPVPTDITELARQVAADHYVGWRLRHLRPSSELVAEFAGAWLDSRSPVLDALTSTRSVVPESAGPWCYARDDLIRLRLLASSREDQHTDLVPDAQPADLAWAEGRLTDAVEGYRKQLDLRPDEPTSWAGLAISLSTTEHGRATDLLNSQPEMVRAVHSAIRERTDAVPNPEDLADWIAQHLSSQR